MLIPRVSCPPDNAALNIDVACCNWPEQYPDRPVVKAGICHCGDSIILDFDVLEEYTAAIVDHDNGDVWTDSCVEFFIAFDGDDGYYNLEANCIGRVLLTHRLGKTEGVEPASVAVLSSIIRQPSLGTHPFEEKAGDNHWTLRLIVPATVFFRHDISSLSGLKAKCNFYKCGDNLSKPHFLSWRPVATETPDFHRPESFADIEFE